MHGVSPARRDRLALTGAAPSPAPVFLPGQRSRRPQIVYEATPRFAARTVAHALGGARQGTWCVELPQGTRRAGRLHPATRARHHSATTCRLLPASCSSSRDRTSTGEFERPVPEIQHINQGLSSVARMLRPRPSRCRRGTLARFPCKGSSHRSVGADPAQGSAVLDEAPGVGGTGLKAGTSSANLGHRALEYPRHTVRYLFRQPLAARFGVSRILPWSLYSRSSQYRSTADRAIMRRTVLQREPAYRDTTEEQNACASNGMRKSFTPLPLDAAKHRNHRRGKS
jgi:hypothetical protein